MDYTFLANKNIWTYKNKNSDLIHIMIKNEENQEIIYEADCMSIEPIDDYLKIRNKNRNYIVINSLGKRVLHNECHNIEKLAPNIYCVSYIKDEEDESFCDNNTIKILYNENFNPIYDVVRLKQAYNLKNCNDTLIYIRSYDSDLCGIIDKNCNVVIPTKYEKINVFTYNDNVYFMASNRSKKKLFDAKGNELSFDCISHYYRTIINGKSLVFIGGKGELFDEIEEINYYFYKYKKGEKWFISNIRGCELPITNNTKYEIVKRSFEYDSYYGETGYNFIKIREGRKIGCIDLYAIDTKYEDVYPIKEELFAAKEHGLWGVINSEGNYIILPKFEDICSVKEEFFVVKEHGFWGVIDCEGNYIILPKFDKIKQHTNPNAYEYFIVKHNDKYGMINSKNEIVIPIENDILIDGFALKGTIFYSYNIYGGRIYEKQNLSSDYSLGYDNEESLNYIRDKSKIDLLYDIER